MKKTNKTEDRHNSPEVALAKNVLITYFKTNNSGTYINAENSEGNLIYDVVSSNDTIKTFQVSNLFLKLIINVFITLPVIVFDVD